MYFEWVRRLLSYDYIYLIPLAISAVVSLRSFKRHWALSFRVFSVLLLTTLIVEVIAILWKWGLNKTFLWQYSPSNMWLYNAFTPIRFICIASFYYLTFSNRSQKRVIFWSASAVVAFSIANYFFIQTPHFVNTWTIVGVNTFTIYLVLAFFHMVLHEGKIISLSSSSEVWIGLGSFLYYSGTLPFFIFFSYLIGIGSPLLRPYLYINDFLNVVMYSMYIIAFLCKPQFQK